MPSPQVPADSISALQTSSTASPSITSENPAHSHPSANKAASPASSSDPWSLNASTMAYTPLVSFNFAHIIFLHAMLDSGAMTSCLSLATANLFRSKYKKHIQVRSTTRTIRHAGNGPLRVIGEALVTFQLSGKEITWIFLLVDGLSREVILGEDFSKAHIKSRHISTNQIELQDGTFIPTYESANGKTADAHSSLVRILGTHTIPTRTSMMIPIITRKHIPHGHMMAIFVPSISYSKARLVSAEIINLQNRVGHILVDNFSQNPYTITPKTIGAVYEIQELKALTIQEYAEMRDKGAIDSSKTRAFPQPLSGKQRRALNREPPSENISALSNEQPNSVPTPSPPTKPENSAASDSPTTEKSTLPPCFSIEEKLTPEQKKQVAALANKYLPAFIMHENDYGRTNVLEHHTELDNKPPIHVRQFPLGLAQSKAVDDWVDQNARPRTNGRLHFPMEFPSICRSQTQRLMASSH